MDNTTNQEVTNYRDQLVGRMKSRYPDRDFDSTDGQNSQNSLEQSILEAFDEDDSRIKDYSALEEKTRSLSDLFNNSPKSAIFLNTLAATGDPSAAIYKAYGKEAHDAFVEGDASEMIASIEAEDAKLRAENEKFEEEKTANLKASFEKLDKWGDSKGLTEDQKVQTFMRFYDILSDALVGIYNEELFEMGWKADHYADDVENARHEGEVTGRNANIKEKMARRQETEALPPALSGQGVRAQEKAPAADNYDPWKLDGEEERNRRFQEEYNNNRRNKKR